MREVKAFIRPTKAGEVYEALRAAGYCCMTFSECEGTGRYTDRDEAFPSLKFPFLHAPMVRLEIFCKDEDAARVVDIIRAHAATGRRGDGLICVLPVTQLYKVRSSAEGVEAL